MRTSSSVARRTSSSVARRTDVFCNKVPSMHTEVTEEGEEGMCPIIGSVPYSTDVTIFSKRSLTPTEDVQELEECPIIGLYPLPNHRSPSWLSKQKQVGPLTRRVLKQSELTIEREREREEEIYIGHLTFNNISAEGAGEKSLIAVPHLPF